MRTFLVYALLAASLVFSVGGVAIVGRADSAQQSHAAASEPNGGQCALPVHADSRIPAALIPVDTDTVSLNTRGYNYADPGDVQMDPTRLAQPDDAVPAAPAKP